MFKKFSELTAIADEGRKAVCCMTALGGNEIEAFRDDNRAFVEVQNGSVVRQAEISLIQFQQLANSCDWSVCGALSADDARIAESAFRWLEGQTLEWQRRGRGKQKDDLVRA